MDKEKDGKKANHIWRVGIGLDVVCVAASCLIIIYSVSRIYEKRQLEQDYWLSGVILLGCMYVARKVQWMLHEIGHLIFGSVAGYRFAGFRFINSLPYCFMALPKEEKKFSYSIYQMGGFTMNIASIVLAGILAAKHTDIPILYGALMVFGIAGLNQTLKEVVPVNVGTAFNDGYKAFILRRDPEIVRAVWIRRWIKQLSAEGMRVKEMPADFFVMPSKLALRNRIVAALGTVCCGYQLDAWEFETADRMMKELLELDTGMIKSHRRALWLERIYCELVGQNRKEVIDEWLTGELERVMEYSKRHDPAMYRIQYAYALLAEKDPVKAEKIKAEFEEVIKTYPIQGAVKEERAMFLYTEQVHERRLLQEKRNGDLNY